MQMKPFEPAVAWDQSEPTAARRPWSPIIGQLLGNACRLSEEQLAQILAHQRRTGMRFGEAAVALHLVERRDVLEALYQQFEYTPGFSPQEGKTELVAAADRFGEQAEAFRELRSRLLLEVMPDAPRCALAIVSPDVGDGKTYLAANLALSYSQLGERVLLMDADVRTPRQHHVLGIKQNGAGLTSVLAGFTNADDLVHEVPGLRNLYFAPAGPIPPNPVELLQRPRFGQLMRELLQEFDHVIVDTPAAARGPDSRVIAARCGAALVVARKGRSRMPPLEGLVGALARGPAQIAGVVVNEH
jgi:chain length determinant protein tyrosine kinase EpsG